MKYIFKITLILLLFPLFSFGNVKDKKHKKSKVIKKEFTVSPNAKISLTNKYGNLNITTWNKDKVEIEVKITVSGHNLDAVEDKLNSIEIEFNETSNNVDAKTIFNKHQNSIWNWWGSSKKVNYNVNYFVKIPITNAVNLNNKYGHIYLGKLSGKANINCDYGKIIVDELNAENNTINLDYCSNSNIEYIKSGVVDLDYSSITINNSETIKLNSDYSNTSCNNTSEINFDIDYGNITINNANTIIGNSDYAHINIGSLRKKLDLDSDYGSINIENLPNNFEEITISSQYAGIKIGIDTNTSFNFILDLKYANFKKNDNVELLKSFSKPTKNYFEGTYGTTPNKSTLKINSQYGGVSFKENH